MRSWDEVLRLLTGRPDYTGDRISLEVVRGMLACLGSPEQHLRFVHVAGTNGKGSACRMLQSVLTAAGYRTGLFISPHLEYMNERWTIDGKMIADAELEESAARVRAAAEQYRAGCARVFQQLYGTPSIEAQRVSAAQRWTIDGKMIADAELEESAARVRAAAERYKGIRPPAFALLTLLAFDYFARMDCDIVVLEVGIGGRLDSTNVIPVPELAVIMNLGLEHTELLGNTIEEIAFEKGGIIKPGGRVVLYHQSGAAEAVIRRLCRERGAQLIVTEPQALVISGDASAPGRCGSGPEGPELSSAVPIYSYHGHTKLRLSLAGLYQRRNLLAVLDGIDVLRRRGWSVPDEAVRQGLSSVTWPGRFEILCRDPLVIVDGAHNPNGVEALVQNLEDPDSPAAGRRILFVFGAMADKDVQEMLRLLAPYAAGFIMETVPDGEGRAESAEVLGAAAGRYFAGPVRTAASIDEALTLAVRAAAAAKEDTAVLCCGSLYQVAEIRRYFGRQTENHPESVRLSG